MGAKSRSVTSIVTPGYAPIEQYSSRGRQGAWTDIYALGGVCYRALTGQIPDDATDRMRDDPLIPVSQRCAGRVSGAFLSAIDAALAVHEGDRPQSVEAWRTAMAKEPVVKRKTSGAALVEKAKGKPKSARSKRFAVILGVVALLVVGGIVKAELEKQRQEEQATLEKQRQQQAELEKQRQEEQASLEKQRQQQAELEKQQHEQAELEKQQQEQAKLEKQRQEEQASLEKQRQQQAELEKQQHEQAELEKQQQEQAKLEKQRQEEQATLEKQRQQQAKLEKQQQEQTFVAEVGRMPRPKGMNEGETDLHIAVRLNLPVLTISLLNQGADIHAKDKFGWTPLHLAATKENASTTVEVLLNQGADIHAKDKFGWTPLHSAASNNTYETAEILLDKGANVNAKDNHGWTPLYWAARKNAYETAEILRRYGGRE